MLGTCLLHLAHTYGEVEQLEKPEKRTTQYAITFSNGLRFHQTIQTTDVQSGHKEEEQEASLYD